MTLIPAYGRKYTNANFMLEDWLQGKDFQIYRGPYCSIRDIERLKRDYPEGVIIRDTRTDTQVQVIAPAKDYIHV